MKLIITIKMDNAAFEDQGKEYEVSRILQRLAGDIATSAITEIDGLSLRDLNGNTIGECAIRD